MYRESLASLYLGWLSGSRGGREARGLRQPIDVAAEIEELPRPCGRQDAVGEIEELGVEIGVAHRTFDAADDVLDVLLEPAAVFQRDRGTHLRFTDPGVTVATTRSRSDTTSARERDRR